MSKAGCGSVQAVWLPRISFKEPQMRDPICFYSRSGAYSEFSNFAPFGFEADGVFWPTMEHYFQAQ